MSRQVSTVLHGIAVAAQFLNFFSTIVPSNYKVWVAMLLAVCQGIMGVAAHYWNPDGTPASVAYIPK